MDKKFDHLDTFEIKRRGLLKDIVRYTETGEFRKGFMGEFLNYFEDIIFSMLSDGEDFFALFIGRLIKEIDLSIKWPMATVVSNGEYILKINPISFIFMSKVESQALIKHEILHLILNHHEREKILKKRYDKTAINLGLDVAVNQFLRNLPPFCEKLNTVNIKLGTNLKFNETLEYYVTEIEKALKENPEARTKLKKPNEIDFSMVHDSWGEDSSHGKESSKEKLDEIIAISRKGGTPEELKSILLDVGPGQVEWTQELKRAIASTPSGKRKTVMRRSRRQPERPELKGELNNYAPEIIVALDISGSIEDKDVIYYLTEIVSIVSSYGRTIRVIECDNKVRVDYRINATSDIRPLTERRRGTAYSPVFELLKKENKNDALLIYFTDGLGEEKLTVRPNHKTLWIVTGNSLSLQKSYGKVIYLDKETQVVERAYGIEAMREMLHEWAK